MAHPISEQVRHPRSSELRVRRPRRTGQFHRDRRADRDHARSQRHPPNHLPQARGTRRVDSSGERYRSKPLLIRCFRHYGPSQSPVPNRPPTTCEPRRCMRQSWREFAPGPDGGMQQVRRAEAGAGAALADGAAVQPVRVRRLPPAGPRAAASPRALEAARGVGLQPDPSAPRRTVLPACGSAADQV